MNIKHLIGKLEEAEVGGKVVVKVSLQCYHVTVVNLLDWVPPKRKQRAAKKKGPKENRFTKDVYRLVIIGIRNRRLFRFVIDR